MTRRTQISIAAAVLLSACGTDAGETYRVIADDARGLRPGAGVYIAGVEVGAVRDVSLGEDGRATIVFDLRVDRSALSRETCASIAAYGLAGPQHLELTPRRRGDPALRGERITCVEDVSTDAMRPLTEIFDEIAAGHGTLGRLVRDPEIADALVRFLEDECEPRREQGEQQAAPAPAPPEADAAPSPAPPEPEPEAEAPPAATKQAPPPAPAEQPQPAKRRSRGASPQSKQLLSPWVD
jgi:hypothetical protein